MRSRVVIVGLVLLVVVGVVMAVRSRSGSTPPPTAQAVAGQVNQAPVSVVVAAAHRADVVARVLASGSVTSIRDAKLGSKISGRVAAVLVDEGARVSAGAPLLTLDTSDLLAQRAQAQASVAAAQAKLQEILAGQRPEERQQVTDAAAQALAALKAAQAQLDLAQANVRRFRALQAQGAVSQQDLDSSETQARVAQAQVVQAQNQYDWARQNWNIMRAGARQEDIQQARAQLAQAQAGLAAIEVQLRDTTLRAAFAGTITQRNVEPGETVSSVSASSSNPLFVLSQVDDVYVELVVPAQHRAELQIDQPATLGIDGLPGRIFQGRVEQIRPAADPVSRTFGVKVRVPNTDGVLRPGMFARGVVVVGVRHGVLQVPDPAVVTATSGPIVFVVREGHAIRRPVGVGEHHDGLVEITSGLGDGDQVVVQGQDALTDNQPVTQRSL